MKKLLSMVLVLVMLAGVLSAMAEPAPVDAAEAVGLPVVGDIVEGFEVKEIRPFAVIGAQVVLFEHQKTGAKLLYVANEDTNRAFQLSFPTRPEDYTGLPHVFEHATLAGSEKYPSTGLWFNLSFQSYNTYMNAHTADALTYYPVASLSEEQLLRLADFYTDSCFHPLIMEREDIYRTEAWRYEMADMDSPLTLNGTVYSEMLGAVTLDFRAMINANTATFPGSSMVYNYGGDPDYIPDMTWEALKEYHLKYYHPSNCLAILYGSFKDYTAFLKLLDEYFSPYEKKEFPFEEEGYARIAEPVISSVPYPVGSDSSTADQASVWYYILCPGMKGDMEQEHLIDHAASLLSDSSSPLMIELRKTFPSGSFGIGREVAAPDDAILVTADGLNNGDAELFRETVDRVLADVAQNGFDPALVDIIATSLKFDAKLAAENSSPVSSVTGNLAYYYAVTGDPFRFVENYESLNRIPEENDSGLLTGAIARWLVNPELYTLTTTYPEAGLKEKHDAELEAKLAEIKAGMSEEEKQAIIDSTNATAPEEDNSEMLASLTAVTVATLPEEIKTYELRDETGDDGVRRIEAVCGTDGISYVALDLDADALPQEDLHYLRLFTRLLGHMDTDRHSWEELEQLTGRYLYNNVFGVNYSGWKDRFHLYAIIEWYALDEDLETAYALVEEILFRTQFTDAKVLLDRIQAQKKAMRDQINQSPLSVLLYRQLGISNESDRYKSYMNFLEYYDFLSELEQTVQEHPEEVAARLENVQRFLANRSGAVAAAAGSEASLALNRPLADAFLAGLDDTVREHVSRDLPVPAQREGLITDSNIQFNIITMPWHVLDPEAEGYAYSALGQLVSDKLMIPDLRDKAGAYGAYCQSDNEDLYLYTYRDPNVSETFAYFDALPDKVSSLAADQETIDRYIISTYSDLAKPAGELTGAIAAINRRINGAPDDDRLRAMRALKTTTPETLKDFAAYLADMLNTNIRGTVGAASSINANAGMFDAVLNPFNAEDLSQAAVTDVPENHEHYQAIRFAVENGYMFLREDGAFSPDDPATVGDFFGGLYMLIGGGTNDPKGCREALASYGLISADQDLDAELREGLLCDILAALGAGITTDDPEAAISRADLADLFMQLTQE